MSTHLARDLHPRDAYALLTSLIVPRPIAMISTVNEAGVVNVAPYSYFMPVTGEPPLLAVTMGASSDEAMKEIESALEQLGNGADRRKS